MKPIVHRNRDISYLLQTGSTPLHYQNKTYSPTNYNNLAQRSSNVVRSSVMLLIPTCKMCARLCQSFLASKCHGGDYSESKACYSTLQGINISDLGAKENHRLKMPFFGGYVSSLEGMFSFCGFSFWRYYEVSQLWRPLVFQKLLLLQGFSSEVESSGDRKTTSNLYRSPHLDKNKPTKNTEPWGIAS